MNKLVAMLSNKTIKERYLVVSLGLAIIYCPMYAVKEGIVSIMDMHGLILLLIVAAAPLLAFGMYPMMSPRSFVSNPGPAIFGIIGLSVMGDVLIETILGLVVLFVVTYFAPRISRANWRS